MILGDGLNGGTAALAAQSAVGADFEHILDLLRRLCARRGKLHARGGNEITTAVTGGLAPPKAMKRQLRILPLPLRDAQGEGQDDSGWGTRG